MQKEPKLKKLHSTLCALLLCANSYALAPLIIGQPQSATVVEGSAVTFVVEVKHPQSIVPAVTSGNLRLWLKADSGVLTDSSNRVSQWQDFSGLTNHCFQTNINKQPLLVPNGFNGRSAIRFDGIQDTNVGDYLQGMANVGLTAGFSSFMVYAKANRLVNEEVPTLIGIPSAFNSVRTFYIRSIADINNEMAFSAWGNDYGSGFRIPVLTPRIWTQRLNTNKSRIEFFETDGVSNFTVARSTSGLLSPGNGYYVGGLGSEKRNFQGDIAEIIYYQGALSDADRLSIEDYLRQKYLSSPDSTVVKYQWRFNGMNIADATNSFISLNHVQPANEGDYSVVVSNSSGSITSSNAFLTVVAANRAPVAISQPFSVDEDTALPITLSATDPDEDALVYNMTVPSHGTLTGTVPNLIYHPSANFYGTDSFIFNVNDGKTNSEEATIFITVTPVNDPPIPVSQNASVYEDNSLSITLIATDVDGDELTYSITTPENGTLSGIAPNLIYAPNADFHGTDSFTFKVNDGQANSVAATINITIVSVNDAPTAIATASPSFLFTCNESSTVVIAPCDGDAIVVLDASHSSDLEDDPLQYSWMEGTNILATGKIVTNSFAVGTHDILLAVDDGSDTGFQTIVLEVITSSESVAELILFVENSELAKNRKKPLIATLSAAVASFAHCQLIPGINQLEAFQRQVDAQIQPSDAALAEEFLHISNEIIRSVKPSVP